MTDITDEMTDAALTAWMRSVGTPRGEMRAALNAALDVLRKTHAVVPKADLTEISDLLAERVHGSSARSPAHNARVKLDAMLAAAEASHDAG